MWALFQLDLDPWLLIFPAVLFLLVIFGGSGAYVGIVLHRRKQMLDEAFTPLGLEGKAYLSFFRQYHGINQRQHQSRPGKQTQCTPAQALPDTENRQNPRNEREGGYQRQG